MNKKKKKEHTSPPAMISLSQGKHYILKNQVEDSVFTSFLTLPPLPFLSPLRQPHQNATEQNIKPEVEMEMNGKVTDQAP